MRQIVKLCGEVFESNVSFDWFKDYARNRMIADLNETSDLAIRMITRVKAAGN